MKLVGTPISCYYREISMVVGLVYDVFADYRWSDNDPPDADAEFEPNETVDALEAAVTRLGYTSLRIGNSERLRQLLDTIRVDVVINIAEGVDARNREAYGPVLLEMAGIPYLGSDGLTLSLSLDKAWTKDLVAAVQVPTPAYRVYRGPEQVTPETLPATFPLFVKPRYEGSSKGITFSSKVETLEHLKAQVAWLCDTYRQDALVESFITGGGEFTVAITGNDPSKALPVLQRAVERKSRIGLHALDRRGYENADLAYDLEGTLSPELEEKLQRYALAVFNKLECKDYARLDFRVDNEGQPWFLEINPLPTFAPDGTFAILAELMGLSYDDFLADTLLKGFQRLGLSRT